MNSDYYINLHFNQAIPQKTGYAFKIGDKGCTFHLHCVDLNPTGMNPHIVFNHSNGTCVEGVPTGSGQDYVYVIQGNEFGVCGQVVVDMKFYDAIEELATQRISTASFTLEVIPDTLTPFDESSSSYADSLEHAREELDDATGDLADMDALFAQTLQDYIDAFGNTAPINPCGEYDPNELYKPRDAVYYTHDGKTVTYMNNLECTGIAPTNTSNWQPLIDIPSLPAVIDSCTSTSTTDALSANQGHVLSNNISAIVNVYGAKNIVKNELYKYGASVTSHDVVFTQLQDDTISMSGTATAGIAIAITPNGFYVPVSGDYKLSGGDSTDLSLVITDHNGATFATAYGTEITVTLNAGEKYILWISVANGTVATGRFFYPMIRDARIVDPTYAPYVPTNRELMSYKTNGIVGSKNLCPPIPSGVNANVTFTSNADKSVTVNGTPNWDYAYNGVEITNYVKAGQTYKVTGGHGVGKHIVLTAMRSDYSFVRDLCDDYGGGVIFTPDFSDYQRINYNIIITQGQTCTNEVFYPMIRPAEDTDETYRPFAMTNKMLTDAVYKKFIPVENISFTAYADGVKTVSALVDDVMTQLQLWINNNPNLAFQLDFMFLQGVSARPTDSMIRDAITIVGFTQIGVGLPNFYMRYIVAQSSGSQIYLANGTFTATDESSAIANDNVVLYIIAFEKT